jgi:hypothetical protein
VKSVKQIKLGQLNLHFVILYGLFLCLMIVFLPVINVYSTKFSLHDTQVIPIDTFMVDGYGYGFTGEETFNAAGLHVYGIGDINNDSYDDFVIGASQYGGSFLLGYGKAYLLLGQPTIQWSDKPLSEVDASFVGETINDTLGRWIAGLGDVNGDGFDDFAISAVGHGNWKGKTYVFFGGSSTSWSLDTSVSQANASFIGESEDDHSGHGIYGVGDVNNDGFNDLLISGEWNDEGGSNAGQVYLVLGRPTNQWTKDTQLPQAANASFLGNTTIKWLGFDAASIGDVNNDSYSDFAIGAIKNTTSIVRQVFIILGRQTSQWQMDQPISAANTSLSFEEWMGPSNDWISGVDDVNDDGFDDFIVGANMDDTGGTDAGQTFLYFGRPVIQSSSFSQANVSFLGESPGNWSGFSVAGAGDVNNDGYSDILIGEVNILDGVAAWGGDNEGMVYLYYGRPTNQWQSIFTLSEADYSFTGENPGDSFGVHVAGVGDVNNDGFSDIAIGAIDYPEAGIIPGKAYLLLGNSTFTLPPTTTPPPTTTVTTTTTTTTTGTAPSWSIGVVLITIVLLFTRRPKKRR